MSEFWFKPKTHGYGVAPSSWKGWALILGVVLTSFALAGVLLMPAALADAAPSSGRLALFAVLEALLMGGFLYVSRKKTDGDWRWRWGKD
jgi:apolipoprotein N-acyltransferase